jgi:hypothetical protein
MAKSAFDAAFEDAFTPPKIHKPVDKRSNDGGFAELADFIIAMPRDRRYYKSEQEMAGDTLYAIAQAQGIPFILRALAMMPEDVPGWSHPLVSTLGRVADRVEHEIERNQ